MRRTAIHLLARLAVAATSMSSAAAFDATHIFHMTDVIVSRSHSLEHRRHESRRENVFCSAIPLPINPRVVAAK